MTEQLQDPNQHSALLKAGAVGAAVISLAGNNMPGVGHETQRVTTTEVSHNLVVDEVPVNLPPSPSDAVITLTPDVGNDYRVDFKTTDSDAHSSELQTSTELDNILAPEDWARVYDIHVTGKASAEDEQDGGGLQAPSVPNTNLALQRALLAAAPVMEAFKAKGIDVQQPVEKIAGEPAEPMMKVDGVEDSWSEQDLASAQSFADKFGYDSVESMVEHHNDGGTPPEVNDFLKPLLEDQRGAEITMKLRGEDGQDKVVLVSVAHDKVTVRDVTHDVSVTDIVNNQVIGNIPEQVESPIVEPIGGDGEKNPRFRTPSTIEIPEPKPTPNLVTETPKPPRPWERGRKDAAFRDKRGAPQGNGSKPVRFGGGEPYNPSPSNFPK